MNLTPPFPICLTVTADKISYAPGEAGVIRVVFTVGGREGREEKSVNIVTDDAPDHPKRLLLTFALPQPVAITPGVAFWKIGESTEPKTLSVVFAEPATTVLGEVQCADTTFTA